MSRSPNATDLKAAGVGVLSAVGAAVAAEFTSIGLAPTPGALIAESVVIGGVGIGAMLVARNVL